MKYLVQSVFVSVVLMCSIAANAGTQALGFEMKVSHIRNDLMQKFNSQSTAEAETKKKREAAKF